uniref:Uncharacterized protein n=1 Tax=Arundo donax TaxID=35708 RepID=A0A0A8Z9T1_ARUDO
MTSVELPPSTNIQCTSEPHMLAAMMKASLWGYSIGQRSSCKNIIGT